MNLKPLADRLVVEVLEEEETTQGGIVLPDTAKEKPQRGKVVAVGEGRINDKGTKLPMNVKQGDQVLFAKYAGTEVTLHGDSYLIMSEADVLAVVD